MDGAVPLPDSRQVVGKCRAVHRRRFPALRLLRMPGAAHRPPRAARAGSGPSPGHARWPRSWWRPACRRRRRAGPRRVETADAAAGSDATGRDRGNAAPAFPPLTPRRSGNASRAARPRQSISTPVARIPLAPRGNAPPSPGAPMTIPFSPRRSTSAASAARGARVRLARKEQAASETVPPGRARALRRPVRRLPRGAAFAAQSDATPPASRDSASTSVPLRFHHPPSSRSTRRKIPVRVAPPVSSADSPSQSGREHASRPPRAWNAGPVPREDRRWRPVTPRRGEFGRHAKPGHARADNSNLNGHAGHPSRSGARDRGRNRDRVCRPPGWRRGDRAWAASTAAGIALPRARDAAIAEDRVQPVPWGMAGVDPRAREHSGLGVAHHENVVAFGSRGVSAFHQDGGRSEVEQSNSPAPSAPRMGGRRLLASEQPRGPRAWFGVRMVARGTSSPVSAATASSRSRESPDLATMTGSSTTAPRYSRSPRATARTISRRGEHADLHGLDVEVVEDGGDLRLDHVRAHFLNRAHGDGVLGGHGGQDRGPVDAERCDGLQIRLNTGSASAVGAGDCQRDGVVGHATSFGSGRGSGTRDGQQRLDMVPFPTPA